MTVGTFKYARIIATVAVGMSLAIAWPPVAALCWNVIRWPFYLPIFLIGARYGPFSGLVCGVAAICVFLTFSRTIGNAWPGILGPDFAVAGLPAGISQASSRSRRPYFTSESDAWPSGDRLLEPEIGIDLNPLASIEIAAGLLAQDDTSEALRRELVGIVLAECEHLSVSIRG
jgi:hypothetical protein